MDKNILKKLMEFHEYPCVSILLPTYRTAPDNQKNGLLLKKLVRESIERLEAEMGKRSSKELTESIQHLASKVDISHTQDGLALFINKEVAEMVDIPFTVKERVIIGQTFATRDLIMGVNRGIHFYILDLSLHKARLIKCMRDQAEEIISGGFPMESGFSMLQLNPTDFSREKEKQIKEFFNRVDKAFHEIYQQDPAKLIVSGVQKNISLFRDVTEQKEIEFMEGNHEEVSVHDMGKKAWEVIQNNMRKERHDALNELQRAISSKRFASGLSDLWPLANEGRIQKLVIEQDYHVRAGVGDDQRFIENPDGDSNLQILPDAVDEIAEIVFQKGGRVVFVDDGLISHFGKIAAILRY